MYPTRRRLAWSSDRPRQRTSPASGRTRPMAMRIVVVLPAPLDPQNPNIDPGATVKPTPSSTWLSPKLLWSPSNSSTCPPDRRRSFLSRTVSGAPARSGPPGESRRPRQDFRARIARGPPLRCHQHMSDRNGLAQPPAGVGLDGLRAAAAGCRACELWEPATQTVFGEGPETARIGFVGGGPGPAGFLCVGEQPGDKGDRRGEPFVGPAGRLLDKALADAGIDRRDAYITNAVKHFRFTPTPKRRIHQSPGAEHLMACRLWLEAEFAVLQPEVVVCLGAVAAKALISPSFRITKDRGQLLPWTPPGAPTPTEDDDEDAPHQTWMLATAHPSAVLRTPDEARGAAYDALVADLAVVAGALA